MLALSLVVLWYWCKIHIQLLSFKIQCLSQRFRTINVLEFKSTAASWNVTLSCLFLSLLLSLVEPFHMVTWACIFPLPFCSSGNLDGNYRTHRMETPELVSTTAVMKPHGRMDFESILPHFWHNTDTSMLCRLFDDRKYIFRHIINHLEYCYLRKQKN